MEAEAVFPVVIIGGGLAGLTAAAHLTAQGVSPLVLEAASQWAGGRLCGGEADTFEYDGRLWSFNPDHGVHALWGGYYNLRATLERFTHTELRPSDGEVWVNRWRREVRSIEAGQAIQFSWIPAPFHYLQLLFRPQFWLTITPLDFLSLPGFLFSILWTVGLDPLKEEIALDGLMMQDYFRGWTPNLRATFTGLGTNLLAASPESISLTAFIAALRFYTMQRRDSWRVEYFTGNSHDQIIQPLIAYIEQHGGKVVAGAAAQRLEHDGTNWRVIIEDDSKRGLRTVTARHIILATNAPSAERLLCSSPATLTKASELRFPKALRNTVIRLWFDRQPHTDASSGMMTGDFEVDNFFWLHKMYDEFSEWQEIGGSAVEVHLYGNDALLDQPDKNLLILAVNEIQRAYPELKGHYIHGAVRRNSRTHTEFRVPTSKSLHVETPWQNLYACGDWIGYDTPSLWMERAATTGIAAANHVLQANGCETYPILSPPRPERLVIALSVVVRAVRLISRPIISGLRLLRHRSAS